MKMRTEKFAVPREHVQPFGVARAHDVHVVDTRQVIEDNEARALELSHVVNAVVVRVVFERGEAHQKFIHEIKHFVGDAVFPVFEFAPDIDFRHSYSS